MKAYLEIIELKKDVVTASGAGDCEFPEYNPVDGGNNPSAAPIGCGGEDVK